VAKVRVYELAKELGVSSKELMGTLSELGEFVRSASSTIERPLVAKLVHVVTMRREISLSADPTGVQSGDPLADEQPAVEPSERSTAAPARGASNTSHRRLTEMLGGSPYSLPDDERGLFLLEEMLPRAQQLERRCDAVKASLASDMSRRLGRVERTSEIFESNKLEGLGPDLRETLAILQDRELLDRASLAVARHSLEACLDAEPDIRDVVGLATARILVDDYLRDRSRALSEADMRAIHKLVLEGHSTAGQYKQYLNTIAGASHQPLPPSDVPDAMHKLTGWIAGSPAPLIWKAAIGHAWLTHIHPFDDGNGRVARLLANFALGHGSYPALIVRATSDRARYLDALAESDEGGNIVPLVRVFVRVLSRAVGDLERPDFALRLFEADLMSRAQPMFDRWTNELNAFLNNVAARLALRNLQLERVGSLSPGDFERQRSRTARETVWVARIRQPGRRQDLLLHLGQMSAPSYAKVEADQVFPSLYVSVRNQQPTAIRTYLPIGPPTGAPTYEFTVEPGERWVLMRHGARLDRIPAGEASVLAAEQISHCAHLLIV
jgi:Fic family protein